MIPTDRFVPLALERRTVFQPECPVYVHCIRRSVERRGGAVLLQVRMVNCGEREVRTVFLRVEGLDAFGKSVYRIDELPVTNCAAAPRSIFGEERMLVLPRTEVERLRVTVERVIFADGTHWRRLPSHRLCTPQEAGYAECACGLPNPPQRERCMLCGSELTPPARMQQPVHIASAASEKPAPILRNDTPRVALLVEEDEAQDTQELPRRELVLLYLFGGVAFLAVIAFLTFCLIHYRN